MSRSDANASRTDPDPGANYADWVGRVLDGRYRIEGLLGEGGMGAVFVAEHLKLRKKVAVKVIHPEFAGDGDVAERFAREAVAAGQLDHPHVASATDYGTLPEGGAYLVMQYVRGESLRDVLDEQGALGWARACEIGAQIADALAAAHQKGFVHRDLKPDNVMLEPRDDGSRLVKVLDFGIARVASESVAGTSARALTRVGTVIGTPGYMSPEQALGEPVDYRADLYALGLVLHEMVTGRQVFDQLELTAIVTRQLTETPPRLSEVVEDVPEELDVLVEKLLARDKDERPEGASEVRDTLRKLVLAAQLQAVASGEHALPPLPTTELAGAAEREPAPLAAPPSVRRPEAGVAPTLAVATGEAPLRKAGAIATAKTALAIDRVRKEVAKAGLPARAIGPVGLGCAAIALLSLAIVGVASLFGGREEEPVEPDGVAPVVAEETVEQRRPARARTAMVPVPSALAQALSDLMSDERNERRRAAREVLAHEPREEVPPFMIELAELEEASSCRRKEEKVQALARIGDPRALPALERIDAEPRNGCRRLFQRYDCYHCLRDDLETALSTLRARIGN
ncbi:MAG TPA: serine/threonine-protein kinase [Sandaracinaceae bacterium]